MSSRLRHGLLISMTIIALLIASVTVSYAETINYFYDDLNRLIRVEYGSGVTIEYTYDRYGNRTQEIIRDTGAPTTTASPPGGIYNTAQSVTLTCNDGYGSGCDKIYYTTDGTTPTTSSPVYSTPINISITTTLKFFAKDLAGNSESVKTQTYTIDTTLPTGTITINSGAASTNSTSVTLTLSCSDTNGCSQMQFSNDNVTYSTAEAYATTKAWTLTSGSGTKTVYVKFKDNPGNWSTAYSDTIVLDTTAPVTTASPAGGTYSTTQTVTLTCADTGGSGCDKIYYTTDGSTPTTSSAVYSSPISISVTTTLKFFARDLAGNSESVKTQTYTIDTTLPTGTITINSGAASTNSTSVTLTLSCSDTNGCSQMQFSNDNVTYSTAEAYATTKAWTLTSGSGTKTVYVKFKDTPGNWSTVYSDTIVFDTTLPTGTITINSGAAYTNSTSVTLSLSCSDANGCSQMRFSNNNVTYSTPESYATTKTWTLTTGTGTKTVYAKFKDNAGNWSNPFTDTITACSSSTARIGITSYTTLQAAYNAAVNGSIIKCLGSRIVENPTINRNIMVTLEGGYDCGFTTNVGGQTIIKGRLNTTVGGGTVTIKNFIIEY